MLRFPALGLGNFFKIDLEVMAPRCAICSPISGPLSSCAILVLVDTVDGVGPPLGTPGALGAMSSSACTKACASPRLSSAAGLNWMFRRSSEPAQMRLQKDLATSVRLPRYSV